MAILFSDAIEYEELQVTLMRKDEWYGTVRLHSSGHSPWSHDVALDLDPVTMEQFQHGVRQSVVEEQQRIVYDVQDPARRIGARLFSTLFEGRAEALYRAKLASAGERSRGLRLRMVIEDAELASLPWEFLFDGQEFISLSTRTPLLRSTVTVDPLGRLLKPIEGRLRVLVVSASTRFRLSLLKMVDDLVKSLEPFPQVETKVIQDARAERIEAAVHDQDFEVLHLVGLGREDRSGPQALELLDKKGDPVVWLDSRLGPLLASKPDLRFVFLCAPYSDRLAGALTRVSPATLGIRGPITPDGAKGFARGLYRAIAQGQPIEAAVTIGRQEIDRQDPGSLEWGLPVFYMQPGQLPLLARPSREAEELEVKHEIARAALSESPADSAERRRWRQVQFRLQIEQQNLATLRAREEIYVDMRSVPAHLKTRIQETEAQVAALEGELEALQTQGGEGE